MVSQFEQLPSVNDVLNTASLAESLKNNQSSFVKTIVREVIALERKRLADNAEARTSLEKVVDLVIQRLNEKTTASLRPVVNATGVILHTNLGRSLFNKKVTEEINAVSTHYSTLEYDVLKGQRGSRYQHVVEILKQLTGAEDALVVNNNAAAVMLVLDTLVRDKQIITSRGELVEIGGSFRVPEIITSVNGTLHEVGTTNKTHLADYEKAINEDTGAILKVHTSNYKIVGFTHSVSESELVTLSRTHAIPLITDLGSGLMVDLSRYGITDEPTVPETAKYSDIVSFSGDKLLGGPQAGIIVGKKRYIEQIKQNQLLRALRIDKLTLAALEATLRIYLTSPNVIEQIPTLTMLTVAEATLKKRAEKLATRLTKLPSVSVAAVAGESEVGGGTFPGFKLPSFLVEMKAEGVSTATLEERLRRSKTPIIVRIQNDKLQFDVRTLTDDEDLELIFETLNHLLSHPG